LSEDEHDPLSAPFDPRTRKTSEGPSVFGQDWRSFAIFDIVESHDASDAPATPLS
jgi:hypothetical protein